MTDCLSSSKWMPAALVAGLFLFFPSLAMAQDVWAAGCAADGTLSGVFCSLSNEFRFLPRVLAILSYASGVILFFLGLHQLREYGDDPSKTPLRSIVIKFVLGAFLISLPLGMNLVARSVAGVNSIEDGGYVKLRRPCAARGSAIGGAAKGC